RCSRSSEISAHDPLKSALTIPRNAHLSTANLISSLTLETLFLLFRHLLDGPNAGIGEPLLKTRKSRL
ncbi:hypothetical protein, partial [Bradyrhizobium liaoningense]|uniref:hypothetical protein n=1 Tax=Bradyrhizobium liaoningense TaxID=43992 RepID=UPI001BAC2917